MAFSASTIWEVRTTGSDSNGGGYSSGGVDYSQQDAAQVALTDMVIDGTTNTIFSSATLGSNSNYIGNIINVTGGTGFTVQRVQIVSRSGANYTVDKSLGTLSSTGGTGNLGGALGGIQKALDLMTVSGMTTYVKLATYSPGALLQTIADDSGYSSLRRVIGYDTTRGDLGRPTISVTGSYGGVNLRCSGFTLENFIISSSGSGTTGILCNPSYGSYVCNCKVTGAWSNVGINGGVVHNCEVTGVTGGSGAITGSDVHGCYVHDNTVKGIDFSTGLGVRATWNLVVNNTGASSDGISCTGYNGFIANNTCHGNGRHGIYFPSYGINTSIFNNLLTSNGGYGLVGPFSPAQNPGSVHHNAHRSNTSGSYSGYSAGLGDVTLSADPYTLAASNDFSLNNTAGGGAACRAAGFPGALPGGTTTGYLDIGAVQHQDSGGGGGMGVLLGNGGGLIR